MLNPLRLGAGLLLTLVFVPVLLLTAGRALPVLEWLGERVTGKKLGGVYPPQRDC